MYHSILHINTNFQHFIVKAKFVFLC